MIIFNCPKCDVKIKAKSEKAGSSAPCPKCGNRLTVPEIVSEDVVKPVGVDEPFELKGDRLGMTLAEFKTKHHREIYDHDLPAPWCSDLFPEETMVPLASEPYFASAGLVNCRLDFPFEASGGKPSPTVAGVPTLSLLYSFVDEKLFKIAATFDAENTQEVYDALEAKYGAPDIEEGEHRLWTNSVSCVGLSEPRSDMSLLTFLHLDLNELAESREPGPAVDDL